MRPRVDAVDERGKPFCEGFERLGPAAREAIFLPDFVEAPRIAPIPPDEIDAPDTKPPGNPDFDRMILGERPAGARLRR